MKNPEPEVEGTAVVTGQILEETLSLWRFSDGEVTCWLPKDRCTWFADSSEMEMPIWMALACKLV